MLNKLKKYSRYLFHVGSHYVVWPICVLSAAKGYIWLGLILSIMITTTQYIVELKLKKTKHLLSFMSVIVIIGFFVDSFFTASGLIEYHANPFKPYFAPPWIVAVWLNFSLVIFTCLKAYFTRYKIMSALCFIGFPLAYYSGIKLGAASLPYGIVGLVILGFIWAILLPSLLLAYDKYFGDTNHA